VTPEELAEERRASAERRRAQFERIRKANPPAEPQEERRLTRAERLKLRDNEFVAPNE
jgi:hypothetical protein